MILFVLVMGGVTALMCHKAGVKQCIVGEKQALKELDREAEHIAKHLVSLLLDTLSLTAVWKDTAPWARPS